MIVAVKVALLFAILADRLVGLGVEEGEAKGPAEQQIDQCLQPSQKEVQTP